jgi:hypothetical protein
MVAITVTFPMQPTPIFYIELQVVIAIARLVAKPPFLLQ